MEGIEQELQNFPSLTGIGALLEPRVKSAERAFHGFAESGDLVPDLEQGGTHSDNGCVNVGQFGAEADEIGIVAVD